MARRVLIVDDQADVRAILEEAIEPLGYEAVVAASGAEALKALPDAEIALVLLDLELPGIAAEEMLRQIERTRPGLRVIALAAHGTVDAAVESMKHGAVDVIQKPFSVDEIRHEVRDWMDESRVNDLRDRNYEDNVRLARTKIQEHEFDGALALLREAAAVDPGRPEALNLIGVIEELRHERVEAQKHYRMALDLDPTYGPAKENLRGSTRSPTRRGRPSLG